MSEQAPAENPAEAIAIIGMAGRFPGAPDVEAFWRNLRQGVESRTTFTDEQLEAAGVDRSLYSRPDYVRSGFVLEGTELFDAAFFGYSPREAEVMDPQQRLFLECAWQALEHGGYEPASFPGPIALFGGTGPSSYLLTRLLPNAQVMESVGAYALTLANDKDFLCTRVAHKLDLRGPAVTVQTACSTGLVAVHMACQSLLSRESDMALAGAVSFSSDPHTGELYSPGGIHSPDGHCRAFDAQAQGTAGSGGVGVVLLKRLSEALEDGDFIHAVVLSTAINNDGSAKVGFTAPGVEGQAAVITEALAVAGVEPESIQFIETHGTGTTLGDPIEVAALNQAFRSRAGQRRTCALGAVKTNIGHTDAAAGLAGLIKVALSLRNREMPPTLHFTQPNPRIDFDGGPFYVNDVLKPWPAPPGAPRRAGLSSFGMGGTNAHAVFEEAPARELQPSAKPRHLLALSARTPEALEQATDNLASWLSSHPEADLGDVAYTLLAGRRRFAHRRVLVCGDTAEAQRLLQSREPGRVLTTEQEANERPVVFLFPGQGTQEPGMAREEYASEPVFRRHLEECCKKLVPHLGFDLREVLYPKQGQEEQAAERLEQTALAQPALFVVEYALARLWMSWGVKPQAMVGHSLGEYVAACLAGVFSVDDALALVAERGRLMQRQPEGAMLSVALSEQELRPLLGAELELASINAPALCVATGPTPAIQALETRLSQQGVQHRRLHTSHAFHSAMMEAALPLFEARVRTLRLSPPKIPFISNVTGTWITAEQATNPRYWADHLRRPVRFAEGVATLLSEPSRIFLEVGPGRALSTLVRQCAGSAAAVTVVGSLGARRERPGTGSPLLEAAGQLWQEGVKLEAAKLYASEKRGRLPLPTYPFQRERYWIERGAGMAMVQQAPGTAGKKTEVGAWFHVPAWKPARLPATGSKELSGTRWLVYVDGTGLGRQVVEGLEASGARVVRVVPRAEGLARLGEREWGLAPGRRADHEALMEELRQQGSLPEHVLHLWSLEPASSLEAEQERGFQDLLALAQALGPRLGQAESTLHVVTCGTQDVTGDEPLRPGNALLLGPCRVLPQEEYPRLRCQLLDVVAPAQGGARLTRLAKQVVAELRAPSHEPLVALRGEHRWVEGYAPHPLPAPSQGLGRLREGGTYLVTGGLGRIGLMMAEYLASAARARLVLVGRSPFPERQEWPAWLAARGEQDGVSRKIRRLQALEARGAQVLLVRADVSQPAQLEQALAQARERFGALHGVVHSAGVVGEDTHVAMRDSTPERCEPLVRAKVRGTLALVEALRDQPLDFVLLQSSISTVLGGLGFSAYAAGNAFLDCLAAVRSREGATPWISVGWDGWQARDEDEAGTSITLPEGMDALRRLLAAPEAARWIVSTHDLAARRTLWVQQVQQAARVPTTRHRRPRLRTAYEAPRDSLERGLTDIWQELLGVAEVGIHDDFFELGGHSLLGTQVLSRVRESFQVELPLRTLFEHPTPAGMATVILQARTAATDTAALEALLSELE
ncbi:type I polyketide synthase [Archangium lipolyticum]|uniref:type I polyketide synthase n=1 Tax=Archangium lipolyticum TaxID=2970465 RepID=UPI00214AF888|nr:type I polyketide synthase [Archangium lipolyticum]